MAGLSLLAALTAGNLPISPSQIQEALGRAGIQQLAQKVGLLPEAISSKLAEFLPGTIDTLTPEGRLPEAGAFEQALGLLKGRLGKERVCGVKPV